MQAIGGEITSQALNDNFSELDSNKIGKDTLQFIDIRDFGAVADGITDNSVAIKAAMDAANGRTVVIPQGNFVTKYVYLNSGQKVLIVGNLIAETGELGNLLYIENISNVTIIGQGGTAKGNAQTTNNFVKAVNSSGIIIRGLRIDGFPNKGIDISTGCSDVLVTENVVTNCNGSTGAGISVFGATTKNVSVTKNIVKTSRIGIAVNGGFNHTISDNICADNVLMGVGLDGIVTDSGDGTKDSVVSGNVVTGCTGTGHGGIYLGNGASRNTIVGNTASNNARTGIRLTGGSAFKPVRNVISNNIVKGNTSNGIEASWAEQSIFSDNMVASNTGRGISLNTSDDNIVSSNQIIANGTEGLIVQSGKNRIHGNKIKGNNEGLEIAAGGSTPDENVVENNDISGNTTANVVTSGNNTFKNNKGFVTENQGIASGLVSGGTIAHGLVKDPSTTPYGTVFVQAKGSASGGPTDIRVTTNATNITVYFSGGGTFDFYWRATTGYVN